MILLDSLVHKESNKRLMVRQAKKSLDHVTMWMKMMIQMKNNYHLMIKFKLVMSICQCHLEHQKTLLVKHARSLNLVAFMTCLM